jgi:hypothetical protein
MHASSGIRTHGLNFRAASTHATDRAKTDRLIYWLQRLNLFINLPEIGAVKTYHKHKYQLGLWNSVSRWPRRCTFCSISSRIPKWRTLNFWGGCKTCASQGETVNFYMLINLQRRTTYNRLFLGKAKNTNEVGCRMLQFIFGFMETTHEPLN